MAAADERPPVQVESAAPAVAAPAVAAPGVIAPVAEEFPAAFVQGLASIRRGQINQGINLIEPPIADALAVNDLTRAERLLNEYADVLRRSGFLVAALEISRRHEAVEKRKVAAERDQLLQEATARFDEQLKAREMAYEESQAALSISRNKTRHLRQQRARAGACFLAGMCAILLWAMVRVRKTRERARFIEENDALTGLRNRRYFNEQVLAREGNRPFEGCLLLVDLDHFKRINETLGHPAGDAVLAAISKRLSTTLDGDGTLVRWGGEEFLGMMAAMSETEAGVAAQRLLHAVRETPVMWKDNAIQCTISIGFARFPIPGAATNISLDNAISLVDKALYEAKQRGRDRACHIRHVQARNDLDLTMIGADFQSAAADRRVQLAEILGAAA
ncbi:MAG: GGDEF domain-containing protein [Gammaproteobacteria bacterium]